MSYKIMLNVYDLSPANKYLYSIGLGFYHTGIEINGKEYSFGGSPEMAGTGIFDNEPLSLDPETFRTSLEMGTIRSMSDFYRVLEELKMDFQAKDYNVVRKNCNHFSEQLSRKLLDRGIPGYINRMAKMGSVCSCLIPKDMTNSDPVMSGNNGGASGGYQYNNVRDTSQPSSFQAFKGKGYKLGDS
mmetsp:Transcript_33071/g.29309  ORF Transcript_33071/g.29309 Transcript_33071/m.29309 type:complete len:186 (-) Transcript_33071:34-591(-)